MTIEIIHPEYTHAFFDALVDNDGVLGKFVPLENVFAVIDATHHRPSKFVKPEGILAAEQIDNSGAPWNRVSSGCAWVMRILIDNKTGRVSALEAGNSSPFTVVQRTFD